MASSLRVLLSIAFGGRSRPFESAGELEEEEDVLSDIEWRWAAFGRSFDGKNRSKSQSRSRTASSLSEWVVEPVDADDEVVVVPRDGVDLLSKFYTIILYERGVGVFFFGLFFLVCRNL